MSLNKTGIAGKIKTVVASEKEFEDLKKQIINTNSLARCVKCGKLLAKLDSDLVSIKRKDVDIVAQVQNMKIKCPVCQTTNQII